MIALIICISLILADRGIYWLSFESVHSTIQMTTINSLAPGMFEWDFISVTFNLTAVIDG